MSSLPMRASPAPVASTEAAPSENAERIRLDLAEAWGEMGAAWGVAPAIARVHIYLMSRGEPLTEREVREALRLSHRASSLALAAAENWGVVERVREPRRVGARGPAGTAYRALGDHWQWFSRVIAHRKRLEGDPIIDVLERTAQAAVDEAAAHPADGELRDLAAWLVNFQAFVRLFDRAVSLVPTVEPRQLERGLRLLAGLSDETLLRLFRVLAEIPDDDVLGVLDGLSRLSPAAARRTTRTLRVLIRTSGRGTE